MSKIIKNFMKLTATVFMTACMALAQTAVVNPRLPAPGEAPAGSPVDKHGSLSIDGSKMRSSKHDNDVQLRGMSFFWGNSAEGKNYYNDDVVGWMTHDWKVDVLRAAVAVANETGGGGNAGYTDGDEEGQWRQLKNVVEGAIKRGIYIIVDWHTNRNHQDAAVAFFTRVAETWGQYPNIIYEIYNEPCDQSGGRCSSEQWSGLKSYSEAVIGAIRGKNSNNIVIVGTRSFSSLLNPNEINSSPVSATNVAYSLHFYAGESHHDNYRDRVTTLVNHSTPKAVFVSEFGTTGASGDGSLNTGNTDTWINNTLDNNKISWVNWSITNKNEASGILKPVITNTTGGWDPANDLSASGTYIRNKLRGSGSGTTATSYTINVTTEGQGRVDRSIAGPNYNYGQNVTLTAVPTGDGWEFDGWSDDASGGDDLRVRINGINLNIKARFIEGSLIRNGFFTHGLQDNDATVWTLPTAGTAGGSISPYNQALRCDVITTSLNNSDLRVTQAGGWIKLDNGVRYRLTFTAWAVSPRTITPTITNNSRSIVHLSGTAASLTTTPQTFTREFTMTRDETNGAVSFLCALEDPTWFLDDVKLVAIPSPPVPPPLTLPTSANIAYGASLSSSALAGGSDIGTWAWSNGEEIPTVANNGYEVTFTPDDTDSYDWSGVEGWDAATSTVRRTVSITVTPAPLTLTAEDKSIFIGEEEPVYTYTVSGFVNEESADVVDLSALAFTLDKPFDNTQTGTFAITPSGAAAANYEIAYVPGTLTVEECPECGTPILNSQLSTLNSSTPLYYNLKGKPLGTTKPTTPGVYIEKQGKYFRKLLILNY